jgi:PilZ domain
MSSLPVPEGRHSKRTLSKERASLIVNLHGQQKRLPCLALDSSKHGFRVRGSLRLRRGQMVEIILDQNTLDALPCNVIWIGKGSKHEGEVGLGAV